MNELFGDGFSRRWSGSSKFGARKEITPPPALSEQAGRPYAARNSARWWGGSITVRSMSAMPLKAPQERTSQKVGVGPRADMP